MLSNFILSSRAGVSFDYQRQPNIVFQILSASTGLNNGHIRNMLKQLPNVRLVDLVTLYTIYFTLKFHDLTWK